MKLIFSKGFIFFSIAVFSFTSCTKDLNREPFYGLNTATVYDDPANYIHVLAKCYAGLAISGDQGPAGKPDILGIDEGFSQYLRVLYNLQELPTDEAVCAWNDPGIPELHNMSWNSDNPFTKAMYYRIYFQIPLCNELIRQSDPATLKSRSFSETDISAISLYHSEARFLRALSYYHAMDLFGNVPFITEEDQPGAFFPKQILRADLFKYIESELKDIEETLADPMQNAYGRADKAAAWSLLARLYLNAEVYTGQARYADCITYCNKVINAGYTLEPKYQNLFLADNNLSREIIFPITFDGLNTQTYGGTTFLVHAPVGGKMDPKAFGINGGWGGYRTTSAFVAQFPDTLDQRNTFFTNGQTLEINSISAFTDGYAIAKWKNVTSTGVPGSDPTGNYVDTNFPLFRLADIYLMYAESVARGGGGDMATAINLVNQLRERAYGDATHDVASIDPLFILDERARELYWEATRRTDLIRFGRFTGGTYIWPWKGGVKEGTSVPDYLSLFPLPAADIIANNNLQQNFGY
ncbi:MAG: RagB/SusD family nutrient uptake outer membrane protein [Chitinophagales bacterium]|nr:RagB/SusD family nutrient uptake outer membrane protein [Chitinophagales bacterium]